MLRLVPQKIYISASGKQSFKMADLDWINHKASVLNKSDKSFKQSIDAPVVDIVDHVNGLDRFLTTSSCSGRIMFINEADPGKRKNGAQFIFVSHDYVRADDADSLLVTCSSLSGNVFLKLEPLIVHIECDTLNLAVDLLHLLKKENEFKHTSIVSAANRKFIVSIKAMAKLEIPVVYGGVVMTDAMQLKRYLEIANERMKENFDAIEKLRVMVKSGLFNKLHEPVKVPAVVQSKVDMDPFLESIVSISPKTDEVISQELPATLSLDDSAKCIILPDGTRVGIVPDGGDRPEISDILASYMISPTLTLLVGDRSVWILLQSEKRNGSKQFNWKRVRVTDDLSRVGLKVLHSQSEDEVYFSINERSFRLAWTIKPVAPKIKVPSFERYGSIVKLTSLLDESVAMQYCESMKADAVVCSPDPFRNVTVLAARRNQLVTTHREAGVSYRIDFSCDTFSSQLVSERARLVDIVASSETVLEIASGVDCVGLAVAKTGCAVTIACSLDPRRALIQESANLNSFRNVQVTSSLDSASHSGVDRLIVSDPMTGEKEIMAAAKRLLKASGRLHVLRRRSGKEGFSMQERGRKDLD